MKRSVFLAGVLGVLLTCPLVRAELSTLTVDIMPTSSAVVGPGGSVSYEIIGLLSGAPSLGLALWGIDLHSSYAIPDGLPQLSPGPEMDSFLFLTNPAGYGGTPSGFDWLLQIGGGQNTIGVPDSLPVVEGIGLSPVVLATGLANLPEEEGTYQLEISNLFGNVLAGEGVGDPPVYPVAPVTPIIDVSSFDIIVVPEPTTLTLLAVGGCALMGRRRLTGDRGPLPETCDRNLAPQA